MMKYELLIRPEAETELVEAFDWYEEQLQGLGSEFLISVDATIHAIVRNPHQFAKIHKEVRRALLHRFPFGVFFLVEDTRIYRSRLLPCQEKPETLAGEEITR
jgi:hypothetical protein